MRIEFLRNTSVAGKFHAAGEVAEVGDKIGRHLVAIKKAFPAEEAVEAAVNEPKAKPSKKDARPVVQNRDDDVADELTSRGIEEDDDVQRT